jgi:AbrB family looped-hinge helix DNA binding protein
MPIIEERKIYRSSKSSLAITLPREWLKYLKLKAGDKVEVEANDELIIRPKKRRKKQG